MWKWIVQLWKNLMSEAEGEQRPPDLSSHAVKPRSLEARSKNIYPKDRKRRRSSPPEEERGAERRGQFRFPVIPDQPKRTSRGSDDLPAPYELFAQSTTRREQDKEGVASKEQPASQAEVPPSKRWENKEQVNESNRERSREQRTPKAERHKESASLEATEIISPIYGRIDPNQRRVSDDPSRNQFHQSEQEHSESDPLRDERMADVNSGDEQENGSAAVEKASPAAVDLTNRWEQSAVEENKPEENSRGERSPEEGTSGEHIDSKATNFSPFLPRETGADAQANQLSDERNGSLQGEARSRSYHSEETDQAEETDRVVGAAAELAVSSELGTNADHDPDDEAAVTLDAAPTSSWSATGQEMTKELWLQQHHNEERERMEDQVRSEQTRPSMQPVAGPSFARTVTPSNVPDRMFGRAAEGRQETYRYPPLDLLQSPPQLEQADEESTSEQRRLLEETLENFNVQAQVVGIVRGPSVTRFELQPAPGVKVNKITGLSDDIKLSLSAKDIRIEAPIPGRNAVGIEVPNRKSMPVYIRQIIESATFREHPSPLAVALGMDIGGEAIVADIKKMPHGLIAGATGSGKSVCINSIIVSLLFKASPDQVRLLLIDPKMVELAPYNHLPHLVTPVVTDAKQATAALKWAVEEMERRYALFVDAGARDIERYNRVAEEALPYIVIIIDELADLMMVSPQDVEDAIIRIAQKARACGIHLLLATQRPSVDVITGNIKANVPTRLAFAVFSQIDSRTILDQSGAERLLGRGDMLFLESGAAPVRLQGNFVSDDEIERITELIKRQRKPDYLFTKEELEQSVQSYDAGEDPLYFEALVHAAEQGQASASALQRRFRIGYNRAARLIEMMEADGYVSGQSGGKPRTVLISPEDAKALTEGTSLF
ncbi:DNA translocase FtsK [Brevibacillus humidisoli]|uniref:DNA translocase FtsK n=1 Tax=Brevibacillus humidisoli TaxID=2895522 RepID=UPI001E56334F|nr:DNA translocase FtsK [Brevibacillus humidisoli]UFJ39346.1 DNA translocase FtsK [Brevibacillus humidisoli]